jgi:pentapeptide MXKDX repeat protein
MMMRLLLAATVAAGLVVAPAAFAEDAMKPTTPKSKTHKAAKVHKKTDRDNMMGEPYSTQKDDMTR